MRLQKLRELAEMEKCINDETRRILIEKSKYEAEIYPYLLLQMKEQKLNERIFARETHLLSSTDLMYMEQINTLISACNLDAFNLGLCLGEIIKLTSSIKNYKEYDEKEMTEDFNKVKGRTIRLVIKTANNTKERTPISEKAKQYVR